MKTFNSLKTFADHLAKTHLRYDNYEKTACEFLGEVLQTEAKDKIGHLQTDTNGFVPWPDLAESTKKQKEDQGYVFNADYNPLYRTGEMRGSIHYFYSKELRKLILGSASLIMLFQELGTIHIPARSVLAFTLFQAAALINYVLGAMLRDWVAGQKLNLRRGVYGSI